MITRRGLEVADVAERLSNMARYFVYGGGFFRGRQQENMATIATVLR